jgi:hypothetical protein
METKVSYSELLRDPQWQRKRLEVLQRDDWKCIHCARGDLTLNVHHRMYRKGAKPWEYDESELQTLCEHCHESGHVFREQIDEFLRDLSPPALSLVLGYVQACAGTLGKRRVAEFKIESDTDGINTRTTRGTWLFGFGACICTNTPSVRRVAEAINSKGESISLPQIDEIRQTFERARKEEDAGA